MKSRSHINGAIFAVLLILAANLCQSLELVDPIPQKDEQVSSERDQNPNYQSDANSDEIDGTAQERSSGRQLLATCAKTKSDMVGPYYTANPPTMTPMPLTTFLRTNNLASTLGKLARDAELPRTGMYRRLIVYGTIRNCAGQALPRYWVDVWHANQAGVYDNRGYTLRGMIQADSLGRFAFQTVGPGRYATRPIRHIHIKIRNANKVEVLTTQIYFDADAPDRARYFVPVAVRNDTVNMYTLWRVVV